MSKIYKAGEKNCEVCGKPLGKVRCSYGKKHFTCGRKACKLKFSRRKDYQTIAEGERHCDGLACTKLVEPGTFPAKQKRFFCSTTCSHKFYHQEPRPNPNTYCPHCGKPITAKYARYCPGHSVLYHREQREIQRCGPFIDLFRKEIRPFVKGRYKSAGKLVDESTQLLHMLTALGVKNINDVTRDHSRYFLLLVRMEKEYPKDRDRRLWVLFDYLTSAGLYRSANPFDRSNGLDNPEFDDECIRSFAALDDYSWLSRKSVAIQMVRSGKRVCDTKGCKNHVPPGAYPANQTAFFCSTICQDCHHATKGEGRVQCAYSGCETQVLYKPGRETCDFYCVKHSKSEKQDARDREECGPFYELFQAYFRNQANGHYERTAGARSEIRDFFEEMNAEGASTINEIGPDHIDMFLEKRRKTTETPRADYVKTMFDYLKETKIYRHDNPVMSRFQYEKQCRRKARPYDQATVSNIWRLLGKRGDTRANAAVALGEESGPRAIDICRSLVKDVKLDEHRIRIRSNKNRRGGWVYFGPQTEHWLRLWLKERPKNCGHDYLLTNAKGGRMQTYTLWPLLKSILLKEYNGHVNEDGLDDFSFHRLRHTNTSRLHARGVKPETNQKNHIWDHAESREGYTGIEDDQMLAECRRTMPKVAALKPKPPWKAMAEYVARRKAAKDGRRDPEGSVS